MKEQYVAYQLELIVNQRLYHKGIITKETFEIVQIKIMKLLSKLSVVEGKNS